MGNDTGVLKRAFTWTKQAFDEFLMAPVLVVLAFILLAIGCYFLDAAYWTADSNPSSTLRWLGQTFGDVKAVSSLLGSIVTGLFTITSITFSLLLLTVQQAGASFTNQVFSQFLGRVGNQLYFGYFVGLSIFALIGLVVANGQHRPIFAAAITVVLTAVALFLIVLLTYTTINQMRSSSIAEAIRSRVIKSRQQQMTLLRATRRGSAFDGQPAERRVRTRDCGFVTSIATDSLARAVADTGQHDLEIEFAVSIGDYVTYDDLVADIRCRGALPERLANDVADAVLKAITLKTHRTLVGDPAYGIEQLASIGWTLISTARSNPYPALMICRMLRDILARWSDEGSLPEDASSPIVYHDRLQFLPLDTLEVLIVAASESMQPQTLAILMRTLAKLLPKLSPQSRERLDDIVRRSLSALGEHVLTSELESALKDMEQSLREVGHSRSADQLAAAVDQLGQSVGNLNSRSTRAQAA